MKSKLVNAVPCYGAKKTMETVGTRRKWKLPLHRAVMLLCRERSMEVQSARAYSHFHIAYHVANHWRVMPYGERDPPSSGLAIGWWLSRWLSQNPCRAVAVVRTPTGQWGLKAEGRKQK